MAIQTSLLGQLLLKAGLVTEEQLDEGLRAQKLQGRRLGSVLVKLGYVTESNLISFLSKQYNAPPINLGEHNPDTSLLKLIPYETARRYQLIPISKDSGSMKIAIADPSNNFAIDDIKFLTGMRVSIYVASESSIMHTIEKYYPKKDKEKFKISEPADTPKDIKDVMENQQDMQDFDNLDKIVGSALDEISVIEDKEEDVLKEIDAPIVKLVNGILTNAVKSRASDIHIEPGEESVRVRYRVDGVLQESLKFPSKIKNALTSRIKILSHLDISERRLPQDGRIKLKFGGNREIDFRVSTLPTNYGEKVVLRLLDKSALQLDLTKLGFAEKAYQDFYEAIDKPYGMILVTGPTGSGKTTTLYSGLTVLNKPGVNIMTAEDPIEYSFYGINQVQIREEIGLTFASALRSFLRQDPDIIMVGEIRDFETAEIGVKAALTGHLVLSTLHTNDAPSTITRLINMGIEPFLVASSVILIVAQRLVRKLCENCKEEKPVPVSLLEKIGFPKNLIPGARPLQGKGCTNCNGTGFRGRMALYEVLPVSDSIKELILQGASGLDVKRESVKHGMLTLRQSGIRKIIEGVTSIDEVLRVTFED